MPRSAILLCLIFWGFAAIAADEPPLSDTGVLLAAYRKEAERREFTLADGAQLKLADAPVMHWSNYGEWLLAVNSAR